MTLENLLNQQDFDFYFLVVDKFLDIKIPELKNFYSIYANGQKNSGQLLADSLHLIKQKSPGKKIAIVPFKPSAKIEFLCRQNNFCLIANPANLNRLLEDKIKFYRLCQQNSLPLIPSIITTLGQNTFKPNQIIQTHFGWAGKSTFQFSSYRKALKKIPPGTPIKISPYLNGYTLTNNCCLSHHGLIQSPPALQYTGLKLYTQNPFATVGRQWPSPATISIHHQIRSITQSFSQKILRPLNYQGFFGLDFLISQNQVYLLECNPRLTASFALYHQLEQNFPITPIFYLHLAEFIGLDYPLDLAKEQSRFNLAIRGAEITPKDKNGKIINKITYLQ